MRVIRDTVFAGVIAIWLMATGYMMAGGGPKHEAIPGDVPGGELVEAAGAIPEEDMGGAPAIQVRQQTPLAETPRSLEELNARMCVAYNDPDTKTRDETLAAAAAAADPEVRNRIFAVNEDASKEVSLADVPGIVKLRAYSVYTDARKESFDCGAIRVADNWFVTAAHCLDQPVDRLEILAGSEDLTDPATVVIEADLALCHEAFSPRQGWLVSDIALVRIPAPEKVPDKVKIAPMVVPGQRFNTVETPSLITAGWGWSRPFTPSDTLRWTRVKLEAASASHLRVSSALGGGPCQGDSGGPAYVESRGGLMLAGVVSSVEKNAQGEDCSGLYYANYTSLSAYRDWVDDIVQACLSDVDDCS
ncbi:MAG: trypsin-like serine protease [Hyphomonas sp.]